MFHQRERSRWCIFIICKWFTDWWQGEEGSGSWMLSALPQKQINTGKKKTLHNVHLQKSDFTCTCAHTHSNIHTRTHFLIHSHKSDLWVILAVFPDSPPPSSPLNLSLSLSVSLHHCLPHSPSFSLALSSPSNPLSNQPCHRWMRQTAAVLMLLPVSLWALSNHWAWAEFNWQFVIVRHHSQDITRHKFNGKGHLLHVTYRSITLVWALVGLKVKIGRSDWWN